MYVLYRFIRKVVYVSCVQPQINNLTISQDQQLFLLIIDAVHEKGDVSQMVLWD
jgi:hypothetical protein